MNAVAQICTQGLDAQMGSLCWFFIQESYSHSVVACPPLLGVGIFSFARYGSDFYSSHYEGKVNKLQIVSSSDYSIFDNYYIPEVTSILLLRSCKVSHLQKKKKKKNPTVFFKKLLII